MRYSKIISVCCLTCLMFFISCNQKQVEQPVVQPAQSIQQDALHDGIDSSKFKFGHLNAFSRDSITWEARKSVYTSLDSAEFAMVYQGDSFNIFKGNDPESYSDDFFYSFQKSSRGLKEFTILRQRDNDFCDGIYYHILSPDNKKISSFLVAGFCSEEGYYDAYYGQFLTDSTYELTIEDNSKTVDLEKGNIVSYAKSLITIHRDGTIYQSPSVSVLKP